MYEIRNTDVNVYALCPRQYSEKQKHISPPANKYQLGGTFLHKVADMFLLKCQEAGGWIELDDLQIERLAAQAGEAVGVTPTHEHYLYISFRLEPLIAGLLHSYRFNWSSDDEKELMDFSSVGGVEENIEHVFQIGGIDAIKVTGRMDVWYRWADDVFEIEDLKSFRYTPSESDLMCHPQGSNYTALFWLKMMEKYGINKIRELHFGLRSYWLQGKKFSIMKTDNDIQRDIARLSAIVAALVQSVADDSWPAKPGHHCGQCFFAPQCDAAASGPVVIEDDDDGLRVINRIELLDVQRTRCKDMLKEYCQTGVILNNGTTQAGMFPTAKGQRFHLGKPKDVA